MSQLLFDLTSGRSEPKPEEMKNVRVFARVRNVRTAERAG